MFHNHEKNLQNVRPIIEVNSFNDYSNITSGPCSKKVQIKRERYWKIRDNQIECQNVMLLEKLYGILSVNPKQKSTVRAASLNYPKRKKEYGRINQENRSIYKSIMEAKPSVNLKKIEKWHESMARYKKNISNSSKRSNPFRPIITQGIANNYPDLRARTSSMSNRTRRLSADIPKIEHFSSLFELEYT